MKNFNRETVGGLCIIALLIIVVIIIVANKFSNEMPKSEKKKNIKVETEPIEEIEVEDIYIEPEKVIVDIDEIKVNADGIKEKAADNNRETQKYVKCTLFEVKNNDEQMAELFYYWNDYKLDAVSDLIHLERVRTLTDSLDDSNGFYYYGDVNEKSIPNGKGLAIYEDNTYYFGDWNNGEREGDGMWLQIFPGKPGNVGSYTGVTEHQYSGGWKNDVPCGSGQEHYTYDPEYITDDLSINNAMGTFKNGYYDKEMLLMIMEPNGNTYDWVGIADEGVFKPYENVANEQGKYPTLRIGPNSKEEQQDYYYMTQQESKNWGVNSLMK